MPTSPVAFL